MEWAKKTQAGSDANAGAASLGHLCRRGLQVAQMSGLSSRLCEPALISLAEDGQHVRESGL